MNAQSSDQTPPARPGQAIIVAHGAPADPAPQEEALQRLASRVAAQLPGWQIAGTTLAAPGALDRVVSDLPEAMVLPFFMAEGWFTRRLLPRRLVAAGHRGPQIPAFGHAPEIAPLILDLLTQAAHARGIGPEAHVLLAAHGSQVARASAERSEALAAILRETSRFRVFTGYIEEPPFIAGVARDAHPALCLPLFATRAGHVAQDLPEALELGGFTGHLLPALGEAAEVPGILAAALRRAAA